MGDVNEQYGHFCMWNNTLQNEKGGQVKWKKKKKTKKKR